MNAFTKQYILLISILLLTWLSPLLGIVVLLSAHLSGAYKKQSILLVPIMILILLGLLLGILLQLGILLPDVVLSALNSLFGYSILLAATLGVYAIYSQVKLLKHIASNKDRIHFIATCILLLPTLYPLVVGVLMLSVAFQLP